MSKEQFVIAWQADSGVLYLSTDGAGALAVESLDDASKFDTFEDGYAAFQQWSAALANLNGAVLLPSEIEGQFDPSKPSPRRAFYDSEEALAAVRNEAMQAVRQATDEAEAMRLRLGHAEAEVTRLAGLAEALSAELAERQQPT